MCARQVHRADTNDTQAALHGWRDGRATHGNRQLANV